MTIGTSAFEGATLKKITLSDKVTSIGNMAFSGCVYLKTVILEGATPPTLGTDVFQRRNELLKIFVPKTAVSAYQTATNWSVYADKIVYEIDSSDLSDYVKAIIVTSETYLYAANREGPNAKIRVDTNASQFTVAERYTDGRLAVGYPIADADAVHKKYAEDNFIPLKQISSGDFQIPQVGYNKELYWVAANTYISPSSLAQRSENGQVRVADPVRDDDAVSKQYFEQHKADLARYVSTSLLGS